MSVGTLFLPRVYEQICPYFCWFKPHFGWFLDGFKSYPPVIKLTHGLLENPPFSSMIFAARNPHSVGKISSYPRLITEG